ncbi:MAG: hypothetical protein OSA99_13810 [Acidimicrobiales bacterium]|nr:hypothetical protein [Acidimicrobiales bacterium]
MPTETERHELYEIAKREINDRFAELMIQSLPPEPETLVTKDDLRVLGAELRVEMRELTAGQTRTLMLGLVGSITAMSVTQLIVAALG